jgi:hypothetical protein
LLHCLLGLLRCGQEDYLLLPAGAGEQAGMHGACLRSFYLLGQPVDVLLVCDSVVLVLDWLRCTPRHLFALCCWLTFIPFLVPFAGVAAGPLHAQQQQHPHHPQQHVEYQPLAAAMRLGQQTGRI